MIVTVACLRLLAIAATIIASPTISPITRKPRRMVHPPVCIIHAPRRGFPHFCQQSTSELNSTPCRDWVQMASVAGALTRRVGRVGIWWNPDHQLDIVGLDEEGQVAILGEAKWHIQPFDYQELERYLGHVCALGNLPRPDALHLLFARAGFAEDVRH